MSNSGLVSYVALSPNHSGARTQPITKITPHYMAGNCSVETCGEIFAPTSRQASSNYGIGSDGRIAMYVEECNRAWTSGSAWNDNRAVTIECANLEDGSLTDDAWESLVALCADICQRNGISDCTYTGDTDGVLTMHKWYQSTDCPGPWLSGQFERLSDEVNARLGGGGGEVRYLLSRAQMAAETMWHLVTDPAHGYSQPNRAGDGTWETITLSDGTAVTIRGGDKDCSESVRQCYEAAGVLGGYWESYTWTGNEHDVLTGAGFVLVSLDDATVGDVLWREGHTELVIEVDGELMQAGFRRSEYHSKDGETGDQDGLESTYSDYHPWEWARCYRYAGPEREGYGQPIQAIKDEREASSMLAAIIHCADAHFGYPKDALVLWTPFGFEYINTRDNVVILDEICEYYTGKPLKRIESRSDANWLYRLQEVTIGNGQETFGKIR